MSDPARFTSRDNYGDWPSKKSTRRRSLRKFIDFEEVKGRGGIGLIKSEIEIVKTDSPV